VLHCVAAEGSVPGKVDNLGEGPVYGRERAAGRSTSRKSKGMFALRAKTFVSAKILPRDLT